jgi:hypothetical protein
VRCGHFAMIAFCNSAYIMSFRTVSALEVIKFDFWSPTRGHATDWHRLEIIVCAVNPHTP